MATLYDQLLPQIVDKLSLLSADNIEIQRSMSSGFSGAEVYEVELKAPSRYSGKYFLKIDRQNEEFINHTVGKAFPHSVDYLEAVQIDSYYVLLIQLAGNSGLEFMSFFDSEPSVCKELIPQVAEDLLEAAIEKETFHPTAMPLSHICNQMVGGKTGPGGAVETFLSDRLANPLSPCIQFQDRIYPNPLYYARNSRSIKDCYYLPAQIHGDFHGENLFFAKQQHDYAIIDWALAREDGILFFDDAYFELSLLLQTFEASSRQQWISLAENICAKNYGNLDFARASVIQVFQESEDAWVKRSTSSPQFSHADKMRLGQLTARVIAGLNFAGKKAVSEDRREQAFIFSCVFLKKLLDEAKYAWAGTQAVCWNQPQSKKPGGMDGIRPLIERCFHFSEEYQYVLVCGSKLPQQEFTIDSLVRIPWRGFLSLSTQTNEPLATKIDETKQLQRLSLTQEPPQLEEDIQNSDVWWAFINGFESDPDTLASSFPAWRNRYLMYLQNIVNTICAAAAPQELMLIIASDSLTAEEIKKVQKLLELFDMDESGTVQAAVLGPEACLNREELENLELLFFDAGLADLAEYASAYLPSRRKAGIWLPQLNKRAGVQLSTDDGRFVSDHLEIIGNHLLDPSAKESDILAFNWGEPITWDAIDRRLPVSRRETEKVIDEIKQQIEEEKWGRYNLSHVPGAGASVLARQVCWQMRRILPVVRIKRIVPNTFEALRRIVDLTSLPTLILLDGDYSLSEVEAVESSLQTDLALQKYVLLYSYRVYSLGEPAQLSVLDVQTAECFQQHYINVLDKSGRYQADEAERRKVELDKLTQTEALAEFRLPFFYGMYTFQEDFVSVTQYVSKIVERARSDPKYRKVVSYLAIITYFTADYGLSYTIAKRLLAPLETPSLRRIRRMLNEGTPSFVYVQRNVYRICHPVFAYNLLLKLYGRDGELATADFCKVCKEFIADVRGQEGGMLPSQYTDQMMTSIFVKRSLMDRTDDASNASRNTFATIVLKLKNPKLQEDLFQCLVKNFPQNPLYFQHYGRLLSNHAPGDLAAAREQFDKAIRLERGNPVHYHARGFMYLRYCQHLLDTERFSKPDDIYNHCKNAVERALEDFEYSLELAQKYPDYRRFQFTLSYPYSSILSVCTSVIGKIQTCYESQYDTPFWDSESTVVSWCRSILSTALRYDMDAVQEHPEVEGNHYFKKARKKLIKVEFTQEQLKSLIARRPEDPDLKIFYLYRLDTRGESLSKLTEIELELIQDYCEAVIRQTGSDRGILWKWFQVCIHRKTFDETHILAFLETLPTLGSSVIANHLLQILYFCRFYKTGDKQDADLSLQYQAACWNLSQDAIIGKHRRSCRFFLSASETPPLVDERKNAINMACTLIENVGKQQSARMTLDLDPRFQIVFIPRHNKAIKIGEGIGKSVDAKIGFSYNGLYGFDLKPR